MTEPKVFISYSRDDADWVRRFAEALREQSVSVWLDEWQISVGESLREIGHASIAGSASNS